MITKTKQDWSIGSTVKVGFMSFTVISVRAEKDGMPDIYTLKSTKKDKMYEFIPYIGLMAI